ncbi:HD domain-containing phosphohydrolase [Thiomicrorhabdus sp.]|uniref:HD domain-containing phosphohydrolase n=1 Tax=Thiomicrorhabdus sp. TaxID=2039724 RepID=UPI0035629840
MNILNKFRISIRITVLSVFLLATAFTASVAIGLQYYFSQSMAIEHALDQYQLTASNTRNHLTEIDNKAIEATRLLSKYPNLIKNGQLDPDARLLFAEMMNNNPLFYAIYIGFGNGDFYELVNLKTNAAVRKQLMATLSDRWVIIRVTGSGQERFRQFEYYDAYFNHRVSRKEASEYDPRKRPWYSNATIDKVYKTAPYLFQHLQAPGQTYSTVIPSTQSVLAVDIALSSISDYLYKQPLSKGGEIYLYQNNGELIASNQNNDGNNELPKASALELSDQQRQYIQQLGKVRISNEMDWPPIDFSVIGEPKGYAIDLVKLISSMTGIQFEFVNGYTWSELLEMFKRDELEILQPVFRSPENEQLGQLSQAILKLPYSIVTQSGQPRISHLKQLIGKSIAIPKGWSIIPIIRQQFPLINIIEVESSRKAIEAVVQGKVYATLDSGIILHHTAEQYFINNIKFHDNLDISDIKLPDELHLMVSKNHPELAQIIETALANISKEQKKFLKNKWFNGMQSKVSSKAKSSVPYPQLMEMIMLPQSQNQLKPMKIKGQNSFVFLTNLSPENSAHGTEYFAVVVPRKNVLSDSLNKVKLSILITSVCLIMLLPLSWLFATPIVVPIRALALENEKIKNRQYDEINPIRSHIIEINDLSSSMVDMSQSIKQHETELKELMDSFVRLIAQAIDDKSPYTAGHCARVPELAIMLALAASETEDGEFKEFNFRSKDELREFTIAAWLHDCGKITTPEHIVDKGTKLETIYNRIHEIRMRFEVLWRDAEIEYLKKLSESPQEQTKLQAELSQKQSRLIKDFEFIAETNVGKEFIDEADIQRLKSLAKITWQRHFDDRVGLSPIEELRLQEKPAELPAEEALLSDKPEHIILRTNKNHYDPKLRINMEIPEHQYNLGELYNLSISRGTLTKEDRFKINEHIISTIKMLENLPFPNELKRVPQYASSHHETLDGTGYPRKLKAPEISIPERILAIADIFEALTASDRPYKKAKPISEAIDILYKMALEHHIDYEVFKLFLSSGVYLQYAERHLSQEQIDEIDIQRYLEPIKA